MRDGWIYYCSIKNRSMKPSQQPTTYQQRHNKGLYRITYQAQSGARHQGVPHDDKTDIINLTKVGGRLGSPEIIVTSQYDFENSFFEVDLLTMRPVEAEPDPVRE